MGTRIEIQTQTIESLHPFGGRHILDFARECAQRLPETDVIEIETPAPFSSGEPDTKTQMKIKIPGGVVELFPKKSLLKDKAFIHSAPYKSVLLRCVARKPVSPQTNQLFSEFFEHMTMKLKEGYE